MPLTFGTPHLFAAVLGGAFLVFFGYVCYTSRKIYRNAMPKRLTPGWEGVCARA